MGKEGFLSKEQLRSYAMDALERVLEISSIDRSRLIIETSLRRFMTADQADYIIDRFKEFVRKNNARN